MMPSVMGLSASVNGVALYWMQSIVRSSLPVFFNARLPLGEEDLTIDLVLALAAQDEVEFLVGLVGVEETAVLSGNERLERELAGCGANGLSAEDLALNSEVRAHGQLVFNNLADAANVNGGIICTLCNLFNLFHCCKM